MDRFKTCCDNALKSSLALVSFCSDIPVDKLEGMYRRACDKDEFITDTFEPVEEEADDHEVGDAKKDCMNVIEEVQSAAALNDVECEDVPSVDGEVPPEFSDLPDKSQLLDILEGKNPEEPFGSEAAKSPEPAAKKAKIDNFLPETLGHAWAMPGNNKFNSMARLLIKLRHSYGGSDVGFLRNARNCRKASTRLNWYQWLI